MSISEGDDHFYYSERVLKTSVYAIILHGYVYYEIYTICLKWEVAVSTKLWIPYFYTKTTKIFSKNKKIPTIVLNCPTEKILKHCTHNQYIDD